MFLYKQKDRPEMHERSFCRKQHMNKEFLKCPLKAGPGSRSCTHWNCFRSSLPGDVAVCPAAKRLSALPRKEVSNEKSSQGFFPCDLILSQNVCPHTTYFSRNIPPFDFSFKNNKPDSFQIEIHSVVLGLVCAQTFPKCSFPSEYKA